MEFGISSIVIILLLTGLLDLSRVFFFRVSLYGAAREGARHAAWYDTANRYNPFLDDADIIVAVNQALGGSGLHVTGNQGQCPGGGGGFTYPYNNPPYPGGYPAPGGSSPLLYICYTDPNGVVYNSRTTAPADNSWRQGDVNVILQWTYGFVTPLLPALFPNGAPMVANAHFTVQGRP